VLSARFLKHLRHHPVLVHFHRNDVPAELGRCGTQAGITRWLCQDNIARLRQRKDQCGDRRLRIRTDNNLSRIQVSKHRFEPFGSSLTVGHFPRSSGKSSAIHYLPSSVTHPQSAKNVARRARPIAATSWQILILLDFQLGHFVSMYGNCF
jgi:hypothetical protein